MKKFTSALLSALCVLSGSSGVLAESSTKNNRPVVQKNTSISLPLIIGLSVATPILTSLSVLGCYKYSEKKKQDAKILKEEKQKKEIQEGKNSPIIQQALKRNNVNNISELPPNELELLLNHFNQSKKNLESMNETPEREKNLLDVSAHISEIEQLCGRSAPAPTVEQLPGTPGAVGGAKSAPQSSAAPEAVRVNGTRTTTTSVVQDGGEEAQPRIYRNPNAGVKMSGPTYTSTDSDQREMQSDLTKSVKLPSEIVQLPEVKKSVQIKSITLFGDENNIKLDSKQFDFPVERLPESKIPLDLQNNTADPNEFRDKAVLTRVKDKRIVVVGVIHFNRIVEMNTEVTELLPKLDFISSLNQCYEPFVVFPNEPDARNTYPKGYIKNLADILDGSVVPCYFSEYSNQIPQVHLAPKIRIEFDQILAPYMQQFYEAFPHGLPWHCSGYRSTKGSTLEERVEEALRMYGYGLGPRSHLDFSASDSVLYLTPINYALLGGELDIIFPDANSPEKKSHAHYSYGQWGVQYDSYKKGVEFRKRLTETLNTTQPHLFPCQLPGSGLSFAIEAANGMYATFPNGDYGEKTGAHNPFHDHLLNCVKYNILSPKKRENSPGKIDYALDLNSLGYMSPPDENGNCQYRSFNSDMSTATAIKIAIYEGVNQSDRREMLIPISKPYSGTLGDFFTRPSNGYVEEVSLNQSDREHLNISNDQFNELMNYGRIDIIGFDFSNSGKTVKSENVIAEPLRK